MLPEQRATSYVQDPKLGTVVVTVADGRPELTGNRDVRLLLDAKDRLVGLDVDPDAARRLVVMLGPHENVARTAMAKVAVDDQGRRFTLEGDAASIIAPGVNPYL